MNKLFHIWIRQFDKQNFKPYNILEEFDKVQADFEIDKELLYDREYCSPNTWFYIGKQVNDE